MTRWADTPTREQIVAGLRDPAVMASVRRQLLSAVRPPLVSVLPVNPVDGDEVYLIADETRGVVFHLRYLDKMPTGYRWHYVGGSALAQYKTSMGSTASDTYTDPSGGTGPDVTLPLAGDWELTFGARIRTSTSGTTGLVSPSIGGSTPTDNDAVQHQSQDAADERSQGATTIYVTVGTPGTLIRLKYRSSNLNTVFFDAVFLRAVPIRVRKA